MIRMRFNNIMTLWEWRRLTLVQPTASFIYFFNLCRSELLRLWCSQQEGTICIGRVENKGISFFSPNVPNNKPSSNLENPEKTGTKSLEGMIDYDRKIFPWKWFRWRESHHTRVVLIYVNQWNLSFYTIFKSSNKNQWKLSLPWVSVQLSPISSRRQLLLNVTWSFNCFLLASSSSSWPKRWWLISQWVTDISASWPSGHCYDS